uniref:Protein kinase domain-containing protein, cytoplasmic-like n=1 Tax=Saccoglossus kowalevskii TaxID=10224 RepID=A0ABM0MDG0_SACKO|nr:PREDICTED: protein kinase domain-containing protein, cytoplasmic-like [Saccoglossus kowalevskii]
MLHELKHPNIGKLLGLCVKSEKPSPSIHLRGVTSVQELGRPVECNWLKKLPWIKRFKICQSIASLLEYLANSPLGSLQIVDFKYQQFVMIDNVIKLIDLDDVSSVEPECNDMPCVIEGKQNMAGIVCRDFHCQGMNTARNLIQAYKLFFNPLLPGDVPAKLHSLVSRLLADIENMNINTRELVKSLQLVEKQWFLLKN